MYKTKIYLRKSGILNTKDGVEKNSKKSVSIGEKLWILKYNPVTGFISILREK